MIALIQTVMTKTMIELSPIAKEDIHIGQFPFLILTSQTLDRPRQGED